MANQGPQSETRLVCIDFDDTIVNGHCHGTLIDLGFVPRNRANGIRDEGVQIIQNGSFTNQVTNQPINGVSLNARGEQLNDARIQQILMGNHQIDNDHRVAGFKNGPAMRDAIREALKNGNKVAITSFTLYPEVLKPALAMIGLTAQEINQVCIVGGYPKDGPNSANGKQEHIEAAMQHFQITQKENVMLVDDSTNNIRIASSKGMQTQNVPKYRDPDPAYFESINQFVSVRPSVRAQNSPQPLAPQQNSPTMGTQAQQPTGPLFYQANQISGQLAKLNQQSLTQWESRPAQSNSVSQFVSPPLSKDQAEKLLSQINPALKGAIYPTRDGNAHRVVINIQEAVKLNSNALFSKNAKIQAQNQNINPNIQTSSNVQTPFAAPPRSPFGQLPPTPIAASRAIPSPISSAAPVSNRVEPGQSQAAATRGPLPRAPAATATPVPQSSPASNVRGPLPQPPQAAMARPLPQPKVAAPSVQQKVQLPPPPIQGPTPVLPAAVPSNYARFTAVTNQQPGRTNLPPPVDQKLVQEAIQIDALKAIFDTSITTLKEQYESFSKAKHASENQGMLHSFAKSIAKSVSGIAKERIQQVNEISQALQAIKTDPNLSVSDKAILAYAHLENVKNIMGDGKSGVKDLCDSLKKQIDDAVKGTKAHYDMNAYGYQSQVKNVLEKAQPTHHKPR